MNQYGAQIQVSRFTSDLPCCGMPRTLSVAAAVAHTSQAVTQLQDAKGATIKVSYKEDIIRFLLPYSAGMSDFIENVTTRLNVLKYKHFRIKCKDEDGDWILITCDKDLEDCLASSVAHKAIRMLAITDQ